MRCRRPAHRGALLALAAVVLGAIVCAADEGSKPNSGPPVGGKTKAFSVQDVTGLAKGGRTRKRRKHSNKLILRRRRSVRYGQLKVKS